MNLKVLCSALCALYNSIVRKPTEQVQLEIPEEHKITVETPVEKVSKKTVAYTEAAKPKKKRGRKKKVVTE